MTNTGARIGLRRKRCGAGPERTADSKFWLSANAWRLCPKGELARSRGLTPG
jgi:hypothetical protein